MQLKIFIRKFHWIIITGMVVLVFIMISLVCAILFPHSSAWINKIQTLLDNHTLGMLIWRLGFLMIIFMTWPYFIKYKAKIHRWPAINIKRAINLRWYILVFLLALDGLFQWINGI